MYLPGPSVTSTWSHRNTVFEDGGRRRLLRGKVPAQTAVGQGVLI